MNGVSRVVGQNQIALTSENLSTCEKFAVAHQMLRLGWNQTSVQLFEELADESHPGALYYLGTLHRDGCQSLEIGRDLLEAEKYFVGALFNGSEEAREPLSQMYQAQLTEYKLPGAFNDMLKGLKNHSDKFADACADGDKSALDNFKKIAEVVTISPENIPIWTELLQKIEQMTV